MCDELAPTNGLQFTIRRLWYCVFIVYKSIGDTIYSACGGSIGAIIVVLNVLVGGGFLTMWLQGGRCGRMCVLGGFSIFTRVKFSG